MTASSQSGYPKRMVINGDTIIAITTAHERSILKVYEQRDYLGRIITALNEQKKTDSVYISQLNEYINEYNLIIDAYKSKERNYTQIIDAQKIVIRDCEKLLRRQKIKSVFIIAGSTGGALMIGIGVGILYERFK